MTSGFNLSIDKHFFFLTFVLAVQLIGKLTTKLTRVIGAIKTKNPNSSWILSWIIKGNNSPPTHESGLFRHAYVLFNREDPMRLIAFKRLKVETLKSLGIWVSEIFTIVEIIKFTCRKIVHDEYFGYFRKGILFFQLNREDILSKK